MQWNSTGLIIGVKKHGETSAIIEAMVKGKGRHLGLVRQGRSKRLRPSLQVGNSVELAWRARLEDHLGTYSVELVKARAALMIANQQKLYLGQTLAAHLHLLPERDAHDDLLDKVIYLLDDCNEPKQLAIELARFELGLLEELGFGLDLYSCAMSGATSGLTHVSPNSGRAATLIEAKPYIEKLLPLPQFLIANEKADKQDIANAFALTGHFLAKYIWQPREIAAPSTRQSLIKLLLNSL